jgi:hypothetical protein
MSTIIEVAQKVTYCHAERLRALSSLRTYIKLRHPDWTPKRLNNSAEFVLSGIEIELMEFWRRPTEGAVHDLPREEF